MAVHLNPAIEQKLHHLAAETQRSPDELAESAIEAYLTHIESLTAAVNEAEAAADRDGWLTHEEVFERLDKRLLKTA